MNEQPFGLDGTATEDELVAYEATPIHYALSECRVDELSLGLKGQAITFDWRPYAKRSAAARADYDRLRASIAAEGIWFPVITWRGHVLIGMRRVEIARALGIRWVQVAEVSEDVRRWWRHDLPRLDRLKAELGPASTG